MFRSLARSLNLSTRRGSEIDSERDVERDAEVGIDLERAGLRSAQTNFLLNANDGVNFGAIATSFFQRRKKHINAEAIVEVGRGHGPIGDDRLPVISDGVA